jgi:hypothetical protein
VVVLMLTMVVTTVAVIVLMLAMVVATICSMRMSVRMRTITFQSLCSILATSWQFLYHSLVSLEIRRFKT